MQFYFAPMEGITGYVYRNAYEACFHGIDKYFAPFIVPHRNRGFKNRELKDIFPENNEKVCLVPQILTNCAEDFLRAAEEFRQLGYEEVNLNLGCPSGTVTAKGKGAGFLAFPQELDAFLEKIFEKSEVRISVKTRIGIENREEFYPVLAIYQKYPLQELIIHPRLLKDYYNNTPDREMFGWAAEEYQGKLFYNGDIFTGKHYEELVRQVPALSGVMIGRGLLRNPGLIREIQGREPVTKEELQEFHERILEGYEEMLSGDRNVLFRMKELWFYMIHMFEEHEKYARQIKKVQTVREYTEIVKGMFRDLSFVDREG